MAKRPAPESHEHLSLHELRRLLAHSERTVERLRRRRDRLRDELEALDADAAKAVIRLVLLGVLGPMRLPEIVDAAVRVAPGLPGLHSSAWIRRQIGEMHDVQRVDRGLYELVDWEDALESWTLPAAAADAPGKS